MEVTHQSDYDTHAIMGGSAAKAFGIINSAEFITVLSSTLYSDAFLAVIREVVCNAWDAHKMVGKEDMPVDITIDETSLKIRDYGPGIDPKKMIDIYCTYGGSTKKQQENQTGGFGLGSKSPFAYTDHFTVHNWFGGKKAIWAISRGSSETGGMPDARTIIDNIPTEESGLMVDIPIQQIDDVANFTKVIRQIVMFGEMNVNLNGVKVRTKEISKAHEGIFFTSSEPYTINGLLYVRYGNVIYPITEHREYEQLYAAATSLMKRTGRTKSHGYERENRSPIYAIFEAEPNSISITPSRESLHTSDRTIATVTKLLNKFLDIAKTLGGNDMLLKHEQKILEIYAANSKDPRELIMHDNLINAYHTNQNDKYATCVGDFYSVEEIVLATACNGYYYDDGNFVAKMKAARLRQIIKNKPTDWDMLKKVEKILKRDPKKWNDYHESKHENRNFGHILSRASAAGLNPKNLIMWNRHGYEGRKAYAGQELYLTQLSLTNLIKLSRRVIMLVEQKSQIKTYGFWQEPEWKQVWEHMPAEGCLVYLMSNKKYLNYEDTKRYWIKQGYLVIDMVAYNREQTPLVKLPLKTVAAPEPRKPKGSYVSFLNVVLNGDAGYRKHLEKPKKDMIYLTNPEWIHRPHKTRESAWDSKMFYWGDHKLKEISDLFGSNGAIALSDDEYKKGLKTGLLDGTTYIVNRIINEIMSNSNYKAVMETEGQFRNLTKHIGSYVYDRLRKTKTGTHLISAPVLTEMEEKYWNMFCHLVQRKNWMSNENIKSLELAWNTTSSWKKDTKDNSIQKQFSRGFERRLPQIRINEILDQLESKKISVKEQVYYESILTMTLFC
jgi:hypothetical protein